MILLFWDASALAKRHSEELGSDVVDILFSLSAPFKMASTPWGYVETYSILLRRFNSKILDSTAFESAISTLQNEMLDIALVTLFSVSDEDIFLSTAMMRKHNLNSTDAAILTVIAAKRSAFETSEIVVVAADKRLLRAAEAEGLRSLNPEETSLAELPVFLSSLGHSL